MDTDLFLIRKMKQGDEAAFNQFVHKYYEEILKYCSYHYSDAGYAEDLTQETFLHFFANLSEYHHRGKTKNCLYTIAGNLCKNLYKKKKDVPSEGEELERVSAPVDNPSDMIVEKVIIEHALDSLPGELKEVVILHYFQDLKLKEIAQVLNIGLPLVKYRVRQAKIQLEHLLRKGEAYESGR